MTENGQTPNRDAQTHRGTAPNDQQLEERTLLESFLHYLGIVWRDRMIVIIATAVGAFGSVVFAVISLQLPPESSPLPNRYEANAMLLQQRGASQGVTASVMASLGIESSTGGIDYGQIAIEVLNSRDFVDRIVERNDVIERYEITEKPVTSSRTTVLSNAAYSYDSRTGILWISYEDTDPEYAAQMVDSMVEELLAWFASRGGSDRLVALQTMEDKLAEVEGQISLLEGRIEEFQRTYGVLRVEEIAETQSNLLADFQAQLLQLDLRISNLEEVSRIENDPELLALRAQRVNVLALMERIKAGYAGSNDLLPPRSQLPALAAEYARLQMDLEIQGRIYEALTEQYEVAKLTADTDPAFTVLQSAEVPEEKSGPRRSQLVAMVTAGALFGSIALVLILHAIRKISSDPEKLRLLNQSEEAN